MVTIGARWALVGIMLFSMVHVIVAVNIYKIKTDSNGWNGWRTLNNGSDNRDNFRYLTQDNVYAICYTPLNVTSWLISPLLHNLPLTNIYLTVNFTFSCQGSLCSKTLKVNYFLGEPFLNTPSQKIQLGYQEDTDKLSDIIAYNALPEPKRLQVIQMSPSRIVGNSFQLILSNLGGCLQVSRVNIWYVECPNMQRDDVEFRNTPTTNQKVVVSGTCKQLVGINVPHNPATMVCNTNGTWTAFNNTCPCLKGQQRVNGTCTDCPPGYYKNQISTGNCSICPLPLTTLYSGSHICYCNSNTIFRENTCINYTCDILSLSITYNSVQLYWSSVISEIADSSRYNVSLNCINNCNGCTNRVVQTGFNETDTTFNSLCIGAKYQIMIFPIAVIATEGNTFELRKKQCNTMITTTLAGEPTHAPVNVDAVPITNSSNVAISWGPPQMNNGAPIEGYTIFYWVLDNIQNQRNGSRRVDVLSFSFTLDILMPQSRYLFQVNAWNKYGNGPMASTNITRTHFVPTQKPTTSKSSATTATIRTTATGASDSITTAEITTAIRTATSTSPTMPSTINTFDSYLPATMPDWQLGIIISSVIISAIIAIIAFILIRKRKSYKKHVHTLHSNGGVEMINDANHATYVDPAEFGDMEEAIKRLAKKLPNSAIKIMEKIGEGQFGSVSKAVWTTDSGFKVDVAVKSIKEDCTLKAKKDFLMEAAMVIQFEHKNIVRVEGVVLSRGRLKMIVMEYMANKSLDNYLRDNDHQFTKLQLAGMASGVAAGMEYLSNKGFIHRDLAARNVLVGDMMLCKIADFGLSREIQQDDEEDQAQYTTEGGQIALRWTEPEAIISRSFTTASDVWSYGITLWEIFSYAARPYGEWGNKKIMHYVNQGYRLAPPVKCPRCIYGLMLRCWLNDRSKRPMFIEIVKLFDSLFRQADDLDIFVDTNIADVSISCWLEDIKLDCYLSKFINANLVNIKYLHSLNETKLIDMGITSSNHIKKILKAIQSAIEVEDSDEDHDYTLLEKES